MLLGAPAARSLDRREEDRPGLESSTHTEGGKSRAAHTDDDLRVWHTDTEKRGEGEGFLAASENRIELNSLFHQPERLGPVMATAPAKSISSSIIFIVG